MNLYALFPFFSFLINFFLLSNLLSKDFKDRKKSPYIFFLIFLMSWQILDVIAWIGHRTLEHHTLLTISRIQTLFWLPLTFLFVNAVYSILNKKIDKWLNIIFVLSIVFSLIGASTDLIIYDIFITEWGIATVNKGLYIPALLSTSLLCWIILHTVLVRSIRQSTNIISKRMFFTISLGMNLAYTTTLITNVIGPYFTIFDNLPLLGSTFITFQSIAIFIAVTKYKLFDFDYSQIAYELFLAIPEGIIIFDKKGKLIDINQNGKDILGVTEEDINDLQYTKYFQKSININEEYNDFYIEINSYNLLISQKNLAYKDKNDSILIVLKDITSIKKNEIDLQNALEKAQISEKTRSEFLANMSHEIRTPINSIIGFNDFISTTENKEEIYNFSHIISLESNKLLNIINSILDLSKIENGKFEANPQSESLFEMLNESSFIYRNIANKKHLTYILDNRVNDEFLVFDKQFIEQTLGNLISNSVKFTSTGEVKLSAIKIIKHNEERLYFEVYDTGIGIPKDKIESIFENFTQANNSIRKDFGGTGLGTTISKQFVALSGGELKVENNRDCGCKFFFDIPYIIGETVTKLELKLKDLNLKDSKILIVDDYELNRVILAKMIRSFKGTYDEAENGEEAIKLVNNNKYDYIFMDFQMPIMDGVTATKLIRETNFIGKIIILTADVFLESEENMSIFDYRLLKPIRKHELLKCFHTLSHNKNKIIEKPNNHIDEPENMHFNYDIMLDEMDGDCDIIKEIVSSFISSNNDRIEQLKNFDIIEENFEKLKEIVHAIKGSALTITANKVAHSADIINQHLHNEIITTKLLQNEIDTLLIEFDNFKSVISTTF